MNSSSHSGMSNHQHEVVTNEWLNTLIKIKKESENSIRKEWEALAHET